MSLDIDYGACLLKGVIGGVGAIPGTCGSHPCDVIKIRMQVKGDRLLPAIKSIHQSSTPASLRNFYRGFFPAIEQRLVTRFPMFLCSELFTQVVHQNTGLSIAQSTFVGSCGSGFTTGFIAGIAEYRKKLLSQNVVSKKEARWGNLFKTAKKHGALPFLFRRLLTAGVCSATYDSVFFGTEVVLRQQQYTASPALSYGGAAVCAVVAAFAFDTAVARMMVIPPQAPCLSLVQTLKQIFAVGQKHATGTKGSALFRVVKCYRGLSARAVEFFINYSITGATSVYIVMAFNRMIESDEDPPPTKYPSSPSRLDFSPSRLDLELRERDLN